MKLEFKASLAACAIALFATSSIGSAQAQTIPEIPAFLPDVASVPASQSTPIDGEWRIDSIRKRIRIEDGRAYAIDPWFHLFTLRIQPRMVVISDISRTGTRTYTGQDLPLVGHWNAQLMPDGTLVANVAGVLGPARYTLSPISLDDQAAFEAEKQGQNMPVSPGRVGGGSDDQVDPGDEDEEPTQPVDDPGFID
jgi:hypothetical protein